MDVTPLSLLEEEDDKELSDYVKTRLLLARNLAMQQYRKVWS